MIIISSKPGYLGNRLIVFANFIAFSMEHGIAVWAPAFDEYCVHYKTTQSASVAGFPSKGFNFSFLNKWLRSFLFKFTHFMARVLIKLKINNRLVRVIEIGWEERQDLSDATFVKLARSTVFLFVYGWQFRDPAGVKKNNAQIKAFFEPLDLYQKNVNEKLIPIKAKTDILIGVHIRHGDYKTFEGGKYYYTTSQYADFMRKATLHYPGKKVSFWICTNQEQSREYFDGLDCHWSTNHLVEDMLALSMCHLIIGPPSTFSMWASFYGQTPLYMINGKEDEMKIETAEISPV